ncbi:MAG: DUF58 domain-containing protein [Armatimonadota bacterium]|nr:DUF58 domain-containing protein [bacterium]
MREPRRANPRVYPTRRLAAVVAAGSAWFFAVPWLGSAMYWFGAGYLAAVIILAIMDYFQVMDSRECCVSRECETVMSLGEKNVVWINAAHIGRRICRVVVRDEPPVEFVGESSTLSFDILPQQRVRVNYKVEPLERGDYSFGDLNVRFFTRLGFVTRQQTIPQSVMVKVYPDVFQTKKHLILARENRINMMGLRKSKMLGQGQEFERLRDYVPDDPLRHVDWKATARRGNLIVREYDVEQSQNIMILLDMGRTMASRTLDADGNSGMSKADYAINASVLLAHVGAGSDDRIGLFCFAKSPIAFLPPGKGASQASALMEALYALQPRAEESDYFENLALLSHRQRKRSLVFLFTDLVDPESSRALISSVSMLVRKHLVVCVALADYELPSIIAAKPENATDIYVQTAAASIIRDRKKALSQLSRLGVVTVDATPADLSIAAVNKYLQLKREARI